MRYHPAQGAAEPSFSGFVREAHGATGNEYVLSLSDLLRIIQKRLWLVVLVAFAFAGVAVGYSLLIPTPEYQSSIRVLIGLEQGNGRPSGLGGEVSGLQDITATMAEAVSTRSVAEDVINRLDLSTSPGAFLSNVDSEQVRDTQFIEVSYQDTDPERARAVASAIGEAFSQRISDISASANAVTATVWDEAQVPQDPVSPKPFRTGLLALIAGTVVGVSLTFLLEHLDDRWRSPEEVEQISGAPTLGVIPGFEPPREKGKTKKEGQD